MTLIEEFGTALASSYGYDEITGMVSSDGSFDGSNEDKPVGSLIGD